MTTAPLGRSLIGRDRVVCLRSMPAAREGRALHRKELPVFRELSLVAGVQSAAEQVRRLRSGQSPYQLLPNRQCAHPPESAPYYGQFGITRLLPHFRTVSQKSKPYSFRSASIRSMLAARCDGTMAATSAASPSSSVAVAKIKGFHGLTAKS